MKELSAYQIDNVSKEFDIEIPTIRAFMEVESRGKGFLPSGKVVILFERHIFYKLSGSIPVSKSRPDLSNPKPGGYLGGEKEWDRLNAAMEFCVTPALESASWGLGQIMGFNYKLAGFDDVHAMVNDFKRGEFEQLRGMMNFIKNNRPLYRALKLKRWATVAQLYNGRNHWKNNYKGKLIEAYEKWQNA